jgi:uncharacterized repeat protein (TIGR03847 family)
MPTLVHEFAWPDRVVIGTVGVPGARTFYLQVRTGKQIVSIALEKQQSAQLAEKIDEILDQLITLEGNPSAFPRALPSNSLTMTSSKRSRSSFGPGP